jgi:hypothetical protein
MISGRSQCPFFHLPHLLLNVTCGAHRFHLRARNIRARAMISTTPNIHIQLMFHPSIPYPCTEPPPEFLFENAGHCQTHFF